MPPTLKILFAIAREGVCLKSLLLPVAGQSSRYEGTRPKWLLTMPDGRLMIEQSVEQIGHEGFDRIMVICLKEHVDRYSSFERMIELFRRSISPKVELLLLDAPTSSQVETIAQAAQRGKIEGAFLVKDCDNTFAFQYKGGNEVAVADLHQLSKINAGNKSYVQTNPMGVITNIVEKHVISNLFCCGAYGFASANQFLERWEKLKQHPDLYLSHVIFDMILDGCEFEASKVSGYQDWGTLKDYREFCDRHLVVFCDVDGVLMKNSSKFAPSSWEYAPIQKNIEALLALQDSGNLYLIVTTSRPYEEKPNLDAALSAFGLNVEHYVMGLPHAARLLINDFSSTNPYPTATAINLERDSASLNLMLGRFTALRG